MPTLTGTPYHAFQRNTVWEAANPRILLTNPGGVTCRQRDGTNALQSRPGSQLQSCTPKPALATSHEPCTSKCAVVMHSRSGTTVPAICKQSLDTLLVWSIESADLLF